MLDVTYLDELGLKAAPFSDRIMGVIGFAAPRPRWLPPDHPFASVDIPALDSTGPYECWLAPDTAGSLILPGLAATRSGNVLFGIVQVEALHDEAASEARDAYDHLFQALDQSFAPHLCRAWNYLPAITAPDRRATERYRAFNTGRQQSIQARRPTLITPPAASALGSRSGSLCVYGLASAQPGQTLENPRQVSAYRYPSAYGPTSPSFSRAILVDGCLMISGTASIVGHESRHVGDIESQTQETLINLDALIDQARHHGFAPGDARLKIYLRKRQHLPVVRKTIARMFPTARLLYLEADICRRELLIEIEAMLLPSCTATA